MSLLNVSALAVSVESPSRTYDVVRDVTFSVAAGETLCIVGESGSGKTVTALSLLRLLEFTSPTTVRGSVDFDGVDLAALSQDAVSEIRGRRVSMIFQEAMEALNPVKRIGVQLVEAAPDLDGAAAIAKAIELLANVGIPDPEAVVLRFPHQLSGGMQQRVMIAMALMNDPELLIADEPTTALDVTIQSEILTLLVKVQAERGMAMVVITHDMGIAAEIADRIAVMYAGRLVEDGPVERVLKIPKHPYTRALLECVPRAERLAPGGELRTIAGSVPSPTEDIVGCRFAARCEIATESCTQSEPILVSVDGPTHRSACFNSDRVAPLDNLTNDVHEQGSTVHFEKDILTVEGVSKVYSASARVGNLGSTGSSHVRAVDDVSLSLREGEFFGLVGESGSGKTTLGRLIAHLEPVTEGRIHVDGHDVTRIRGRAANRAFRRDVQIVFQDPSGSLDPRQTIGQALAEPLRSLHGMSRKAARERVEELLVDVGLPVEHADRHASEISGGQRQRVAIARALAAAPRLIVADEPTSALDVSVQGQIVNLLRRLQREHGLTLLTITHNLSLVQAVADRIGVLYLGKLVEITTATALAHGPSHPYTQILLAANPDPAAPRSRAERLAAPLLSTDVYSSVLDRSVGCRFRDRCALRQARCDEEDPQMRETGPNQFVACHFPLQVGATTQTGGSSK